MLAVAHSGPQWAWLVPVAQPLIPPARPPPLQNYFSAGGPGGLPDPLLMQAQVPFRTPAGGVAGLPAGFMAQPASANLFSSITLPDTLMGGGSGKGGKKSAEQRAAAVQEKNRRAQKRFRERQVRV